MKKGFPGSGGKGAVKGDPKLNKHLQTPIRNIERTSHTQDDRTVWPGMYDMAKSILKDKK